jgi:hypothetical protein
MHAPLRLYREAPDVPMLVASVSEPVPTDGYLRVVQHLPRSIRQKMLGRTPPEDARCVPMVPDHGYADLDVTAVVNVKAVPEFGDTVILAESIGGEIRNVYRLYHPAADIPIGTELVGIAIGFVALPRASCR